MLVLPSRLKQLSFWQAFEHPPWILPILPCGCGFILAFAVHLGLALSAIKQHRETSKAERRPWRKYALQKLSIGNFKVETMRMCIEEIRRVESTPVPPGAKRPSRNEIAVSFGLSPSSVSSDIDLPYVFSGMQPLALPSVFPWLPLQKQ